MNDLLDSAYWCSLQVTVVIAFGLLLAGRFTFKRPDQAGIIICVTLIAVGLLTVFAPLPVHHLVSQFSLATADQALPAEYERARDVAIQDYAVKPLEPTISIHWPQLTSFAQRIAHQATVPRKNAWISLTMAAWFSAIALLIGIIRLTISLQFVVNTRRSSISVRDRAACEKVVELATKIRCRRVPELYENPELHSAAVVGPFKPTLVLPHGWREWSHDELAAVLAHELAHIARADSTWRLLACCIQAVHFFNPLAHWLLDRLVLLQEFSADDKAARVIGRRNYLKSLSQLALRRDQSTGQGCPAVLPVFTGHLKRRIAMLRSTDGSHSIMANGSHQRVAWAITAMVVLCIAVVSLRGVAAAEDDAKQLTQVRRVSTTKLVEKKRPLLSSNGFQREAIPASLVGVNETGYMTVRVSELLTHPIVKPFAPMLTPSMVFQELAPVPFDYAGIDFNKIESISAQAVVTLNRNSEANTDHNHRLTFQTSGCTIQLTDDVQLHSWMKNYLSAAKPIETENLATFEIPVDVAAPMPIRIQQTESRTIKLGWPIAGQSETDIMFPIVKPHHAGNSEHILRAWNAVSGGLAAAVMGDANIISSIEVPVEGSDIEIATSQLAAFLVEHCSCVAYGLDLNEAGDVLIQVRLTHDSVGKAQQTVNNIQDLKASMKNELQNLEDPSKRATSELCVDWLDKATIKTRPYDDSSCDVVMHSQLPFVVVLNLIKTGNP